MGVDNVNGGKQCWQAGDAEMRDWFSRQWRAWPKRVDSERTTNMSFLYGGVLAFRETHGHSPLLGVSFSGHVAWLDKHAE